MKQAFAGIDIGTSSVKVDLVDAAGGLISEATASYKSYSSQIGWAEQEPEEWWQAVWTSLRAAVAQARSQHGRIELAGIGVTGQMHSSVLLDGTGRPLRPAIVWMDSRARDLMPELELKFQERSLSHVLKNAPAPGLTLAPLIWLRRNENQTLDAASTLLVAKDYIRYRLTGEIATDATDASGTLMFDLEKREWSEAVCREFGIPTGMLPPVRSSHEAAGLLKEELSAELELQTPPTVAIGCSDQSAAAVASGVLTPGVMQLMLGTGAQVMSPVSRADIAVPRSLNMFCLPDLWCLQGSLQNAGAALNWMRSTFRADWDEVMATATERPYGPLFLPYLTGERTPIMDEQASGAFLGVRFGAERRHLLFAVFEGVVHSICDAIEEFDHLPDAKTGSPGEIRCGGGGAGQAAYVQLIADYLGRPVSVLGRAGSTALGAAMLGAVAGGCFPNSDAAVASMGLKIGKVVEPDAGRVSEARARRQEYQLRRDRYLETERIIRSRLAVQ